MTTTKKKSFDCVDMKNNAQAALLEEYEKRRGEFSDFATFVHETRSEWEKAALARLLKRKSKASA